MYRNDPFSQWVFRYEQAKELLAGVNVDRQVQTRIRNDLASLAKTLADSGDAKPVYGNNLTLYPTIGPLKGLTAADIDTAMELYRQVLERGGRGQSYVQEELLTMLAMTTDPATIPFWVEIACSKSKNRTFSQERRAIALSALAFMACVYEIDQIVK